ncbi:MAG TPA: TlpA disulfide reductase family protein [Candidatus Baltobacteraceae bacterium]|jgi:thiol-disulfide isomerase/thioredoxin|nr:TlpA disulfide reductase family protein [Candidatus Baltobacteraceae bacterium]
MKNPRIWVWITIAVVIIGVALAIRFANSGGVSKQATRAPIQAPLKVGDTAPEFTAVTNQGYFDLAKTAKPVFLEVFATWCPHCQRETAIIDQLYQKYSTQVAFVAVTGSNTSMDGQGQSSEVDVLNFAQALHAKYPLAYDGSLAVANKYLQGGFPTLVIIGRDKKISFITSGETPFSELDSAIKAALR